MRNIKREAVEDNDQVLLDAIKEELGENMEIPYYRDRYDELDPKDFNRIVNSDNPMEEYYETLDDVYNNFDYIIDNSEYYAHYIVENHPELADYEDDIKYLIQENATIEYPDYTGDNFPVSISFATAEDINYDLSLTPSQEYPNVDEDDLDSEYIDFDYMRNSFFGKLVESQGYDLKTTLKVLLGYADLEDYPEYKNSKFIDSLRQEFVEAYSGGLITVLGTISLEDAIALKEGTKRVVLKAGGSNYIGIYNGSNGSGGEFDLVLEKDYIVDPQDIYAIGHAYESKNSPLYSVQETYGFVNKIYESYINIK